MKEGRQGSLGSGGEGAFLHFVSPAGSGFHHPELQQQAPETQRSRVGCSALVTAVCAPTITPDRKRALLGKGHIGKGSREEAELSSAQKTKAQLPRPSGWAGPSPQASAESSDWSG